MVHYISSVYMIINFVKAVNDIQKIQAEQHTPSNFQYLSDSQRRTTKFLRARPSQS